MEDIFMSIKEAERYRLFKSYQANEISLNKIAKLLKISYRHTKRCWSNFKKLGPKGLISKKRGKQSSRRLSPKLEEDIVRLIKSLYFDFGPTLIMEKLQEKHQITISRETVRKLMIRNSLWIAKKTKEYKIHQRRARKECVGELIQIDGSPHPWLEKRAPSCTLLLAIDDATSKIMAGRFEKGETTEGYFKLMFSYLKTHGKPFCLYSDKYSVFRVNHKNSNHKKTQFTRAMKDLNIDIIFANSPQAKGRVERANGTLQDRLVKELRLQNITTIDQANQFLPSFIEAFNKRFGKTPTSPIDAHRLLNQNEDLNKTLCFKTKRKISKNLEVSYDNVIYQIDAPLQINRLRGSLVTLIKTLNEEIYFEYKGRYLNYKKFQDLPVPIKIIDYKELATRWEKSLKKTHKPNMKHPWRTSL